MGLVDDDGEFAVAVLVPNGVQDKWELLNGGNDDEEEETTEDIINRIMEARKMLTNASYFACFML